MLYPSELQPLIHRLHRFYYHPAAPAWTPVLKDLLNSMNVERIPPKA